MLIHPPLTLQVALYTSAWIEISSSLASMALVSVALYTSAWIEIRQKGSNIPVKQPVALYTSAWIEIHSCRRSFGNT